MSKQQQVNKPKNEQESKAAVSENSVMEVFAFFNEVGIINQLASTILAGSLPDGVHPSHFAIINHLYRLGDGRSPLRIAAAMQVTKTTMTHSLKVLEGKGYISIKPNPEDARGKLVFLSAGGRQFRDKAIAQTVAAFGHVLSDEQVSRMKKLLPELTELRQFLDSNRLQ